MSSFFRVTLTGRKPFSSFTVPGANPSVVVGRAGALLDADTAKALKKALEAKEIPNVTVNDVAFEEVKRPGTADGTSAKASSEAARVEELEAQVEQLQGDLEAAQAGGTEAEALRTRVAELEAQAAESDATKLASGILDSMTVPQLTDLAKARKVEHPSSATKADVIGAIVGAPATS